MARVGPASDEKGCPAVVCLLCLRKLPTK
jgi:hypothetical protein